MFRNYYIYVHTYSMLMVCNSSVRVKTKTLERLKLYQEHLGKGINARFTLDQTIDRLLFKEGF